MRILSTTTSIAIGFGCIVVSTILGAQMFGLLPDSNRTLTRQRLHLAQTISAQCSSAADRNDAESIKGLLGSLVTNNPDVVSAGVRAPDNALVIQAGPHEKNWLPPSDKMPPGTFETVVPIYQNNEKWATVELLFAKLPETTFFNNPLVRITAFAGCAGFIGSLLFLRKVLKHLDPTSVIPDRVRTMLDALAEGVIVMDNDAQIVMANDSFCRITKTTLKQVQGRKISSIPGFDDGPNEQPWIREIREGQTIRRITIKFTAANTEPRTLVLNAVPITAVNGSRRGMLATFDDVTSVEYTNTQLRDTLGELAKSRDEIERQNKELEILASRDPLTGCLNRRVFMRAFEELWKQTRENNSRLACIMIDIDHFKQVNDQHGHSVGDQVLKHMSTILNTSFRADDLVCRFGGEEFCILLPSASFEIARLAADRLRESILQSKWPIPSVTASIGVSGIEHEAADARALIDQADKALYAAKRTGRNRVVSWGDPSIESAAAEKPADRRRGVDSGPQMRQAANALLESLARRDNATAQHSRRVADLSVLLAGEQMDKEETDLLRLAALLHDVGKLAIPDSILHKPSVLTDEEWKTMRRHEDMGADLVQQVIGNPKLTEIIRSHHARYSGTPTAPHLPFGEQIPLSCRILLIADAYDAMVSERAYRKALTHEQACAELMRCAGSQFDPILTKRFIELLNQRPEKSADALDGLTPATLAAITELALQADEIRAIAESAQSAAEPAQTARNN